MPSENLLESDSSPIIESEPWTVSPPLNAWKLSPAGIWTHLLYGPLPRYGWKIHVSSTLENAPTILQIVSEVAFRHECSFKHLNGLEAFLLLHFKNESRLQSGKFIALYPPTE